MRALFLLLTIASGSLYGQKVINLYDGTPPNAKIVNAPPHAVVERSSRQFVTDVTVPTLTLFLPAKEKSTGTAVLICPGGGYSVVAELHEGEAIAKKLNDIGVAAMVLRYRLPNPKFVDNKEFVPLQDAQRALIIIRENAKEWGIDPTRVGILGSSAGGHLASTIGTHFKKTYAQNPKRINVRPDFMILNYPVISFADSITHYGSRFNLAGPVLTEQEAQRFTVNGRMDQKKIPIDVEKIKEYSNELQVSPETPPTFITHAYNDDVVPIENAILFAASLQQHGVDVRTFFYTKGGHGYGLDNPTSDRDWFDDCTKWMGARGLLKR
jgi:acetyl esterase/lipase